MNAQKGVRKRFSSLLATGTTALLVLSGIALAPAAATADEAVFVPEIELSIDGSPIDAATPVFAGDVITVTGSGFDPSANIGTRPPLAGKESGIYVVFGNFASDWQPSGGNGARSIVDQKWPMPQSSIDSPSQPWSPKNLEQLVVLEDDGSFETTLTVGTAEATPGAYGVYTFAAGGPKNAAHELEQLVNYQGKTTTELTFSKSSLAYNAANSAIVTVKMEDDVPDTPTGEVSVTIAGKTYAATLKNGSAKIALSPAVKAGTHNVEASYSGAPGKFASSSSSPAVKLKVAKTTPKVAIKLVKSKVKASKHAKLKVTVSIPGSLKTKASKYKVQIFDGAKMIKTTKLNTAGKISVTLPKIKKVAKHKIKVKVLSTASTTAKTSAKKTLTVVR